MAPAHAQDWANRKSENRSEVDRRAGTHTLGVVALLEQKVDTTDGTPYLAEDEYSVTDLVPSEMACFESSPGRMRRTAVWISCDSESQFTSRAGTRQGQQESDLEVLAAEALVVVLGEVDLDLKV